MRKTDPVELVAIAIPVIAELITVVSFICMIVVWIAIANTPVPV